jgi:lysophospholipase L1-like esterase
LAKRASPRHEPCILLLWDSAHTPCRPRGASLDAMDTSATLAEPRKRSRSPSCVDSSRTAGSAYPLPATSPAWLAIRGSLCLAALAGVFSVSGKATRRIGIATQLTRLSRPFNATPAAPQASLLIVGDSTALGTGASTPEASLAGRIAQRYPSLAICNLAGASACFETIADQLAQAGRHDLILIAGGANDVMRFTSARRLARSVELVLSRAAPQAGKVLVMPAPNVGNAPFFPPPLSWLFSHRARALHRLVRANAVAVGAAYVNLYRHRADDPFARDLQRLIALDRG